MSRIPASGQPTKLFMLMAALFGLTFGATAPAYADFFPVTFNIDDLAEGPITVSSPTGFPFTILPDSTNDFVHFTFFDDFVGPSYSWTSELFDVAPPGTVNPTLSDRFVYTQNGITSFVDVQFDSRDPVLLQRPGGGCCNFFTEDGTYQGMFYFPVGGLFITINARSDVVESVGVPEPWTLALFGAGLAGLAVYRRRKARTEKAAA